MKLLSSQNRVLTVVAIAFCMIYLDITVLAVALPTIQKNFNTTSGLALWVVNIYMLMRAILVFASGQLSDIFTSYKAFMFGLVVFAFSSLGCGFSPTIEWLIAFRLLQGVGATFIFVPGMSLITSSSQEEKRGRSIAFVLSIGLASLAAGPLVGGIVIKIASWQWIFFLNAIAAVLAIILSLSLKIDSDKRHDKGKFDWFGFILTAIFTLCVNTAFEKSNTWHWASFNFISLIAVSIITLIVFVYIEQRKAHPIIDFKLFALPNFSAGCMIASLVQISVLLMVYLGIFFQNALGYSPFMAGCLLLPMAVTGVIFSNVGGQLVDKYGSKVPLVLGTGSIVLGFILTLIFFYTLSYYAMLPLLVLSGMGMFMISGPTRTAMLKQTPKNKYGMTNSILTGVRSIISVIGFAIVGAIIANVEFYQAKLRILSVAPALLNNQIHNLLGVLSNTEESKAILSQFNPSIQIAIKNIILNSYATGVFWSLVFVALLMLISFILSVFFIKK
jgi:EmrB/QacA subfamily drug resistance transporter